MLAREYFDLRTYISIVTLNTFNGLLLLGPIYDAP